MPRVWMDAGESCHQYLEQCNHGIQGSCSKRFEWLHSGHATAVNNMLDAMWLEAGPDNTSLGLPRPSELDKARPRLVYVYRVLLLAFFLCR